MGYLEPNLFSRLPKKKVDREKENVRESLPLWLSAKWQLTYCSNLNIYLGDVRTIKYVRTSMGAIGFLQLLSF